MFFVFVVKYICVRKIFMAFANLSVICWNVIVGLRAPLAGTHYAEEHTLVKVIEITVFTKGHILHIHMTDSALLTSKFVLYIKFASF